MGKSHSEIDLLIFGRCNDDISQIKRRMREFLIPYLEEERNFSR